MCMCIYAVRPPYWYPAKRVVFSHDNMTAAGQFLGIQKVDFFGYLFFRCFLNGENADIAGVFCLFCLPKNFGE